MEKLGKWLYMLSKEDTYYESDLYDTEAEALQAGLEKAIDLGGYKKISIAQMVIFDPEFDIAEKLIDDLQAKADDYFGENSDGYLEGVSNEALFDLDDLIAEAFHEWLEMHPKYNKEVYRLTNENEYEFAVGKEVGNGHEYGYSREDNVR